MKKQLISMVVLLMTALALVGCQALDIIGNRSVDSFAELVSALPVSPTRYDGFWRVETPDATASLYLPAQSTQKDPARGAYLFFEAAPFFAAGLSPEQLPEPVSIIKDGQLLSPSESAGLDLSVGSVQLAVGTDDVLSSEYGLRASSLPALVSVSSGAGKPEEVQRSYRSLVEAAPDRIGHHAAMDHFGISLGEGNAFEFAQDIGDNEADMVFALNPEPFRAAGADLEKIEGWKLSMVEVADEQGKMIETEKLLKIFDLK
jgi:hypothetical protein